MIDEKGLTDPEVYKGANLDRRLFSKIRSNENYKPRKNTILALAVSMDLSVEETENLLKKAGYTLSRSLTGDLIVLFYLQRGNRIFMKSTRLFSTSTSPAGKCVITKDCEKMIPIFHSLLL